MDCVERGNVGCPDGARHEHRFAMHIRQTMKLGEKFRLNPDGRIEQMDLVPAVGKLRNRIHDIASDAGVKRLGNEANLQVANLGCGWRGVHCSNSLTYWVPKLVSAPVASNKPAWGAD